MALIEQRLSYARLLPDQATGPPAHHEEAPRILHAQRLVELDAIAEAVLGKDAPLVVQGLRVDVAAVQAAAELLQVRVQVGHESERQLLPVLRRVVVDGDALGRAALGGWAAEGTPPARVFRGSPDFAASRSALCGRLRQYAANAVWKLRTCGEAGAS